MFFANPNPLKRPYNYSNTDPDLKNSLKRPFKIQHKEIEPTETDKEKRHFMMLSSIKSISNKGIPLSTFTTNTQNYKKYHLELINRENLIEKQRRAQQELDLYKEQMAFYSNDCCLYPKSDCSQI